MTKIISSLPSEQESPILCCYVNVTSQIQVIRIVDLPSYYFERAVFPGQRLFFEALPSAELEVHTGMTIGSILADKISCLHLQVDNGN
ncbi:DUF1830 domain-containing protein [Chroococcidiopsis sp. FACHB-1243]|uniref:DUF1830 domain-containing protein n=1 Tax=Chroococcidiopsis sp. [FACHB-1243] TaxID=2692781 RepID=UPI001785F0B9|nr:DUF1830 domain-containing protein [Chroococcidiopsis sp. [FACHB-1243]]MBD2304390.1 DUF1830 domain-containing protein [Chroococcidiopsis sp. [FACHB-1243]]